MALYFIRSIRSLCIYVTRTHWSFLGMQYGLSVPVLGKDFGVLVHRHKSNSRMASSPLQSRIHMSKQDKIDCQNWKSPKQLSYCRPIWGVDVCFQEIPSNNLWTDFLLGFRNFSSAACSYYSTSLDREDAEQMAGFMLGQGVSKRRQCKKNTKKNTTVTVSCLFKWTSNLQNNKNIYMENTYIVSGRWSQIGETVEAMSATVVPLTWSCNTLQHAWEESKLDPGNT